MTDDTLLTPYTEEEIQWKVREFVTSRTKNSMFQIDDIVKHFNLRLMDVHYVKRSLQELDKKHIIHRLGRAGWKASFPSMAEKVWSRERKSHSTPALPETRQPRILEAKPASILALPAPAEKPKKLSMDSSPLTVGLHTDDNWMNLSLPPATVPKAEPEVKPVEMRVIPEKVLGKINKSEKIRQYLKTLAAGFRFATPTIAKELRRYDIDADSVSATCSTLTKKGAIKFIEKRKIGRAFIYEIIDPRLIPTRDDYTRLEPSISEDRRVITVLEPANPKRGKSAERYAMYKDGMTVAEYCEVGGTLADVRWDVEHGFIALSEKVAEPVIPTSETVSFTVEEQAFTPKLDLEARLQLINDQVELIRQEWNAMLEIATQPVPVKTLADFTDSQMLAELTRRNAEKNG